MSILEAQTGIGDLFSKIKEDTKIGGGRIYGLNLRGVMIKYIV